MKNHSKTTKKKVDVFKKIYIQEFLRGHRPEIIIQAIADRYLTTEQTVRGLIRPATLKTQIKMGMHTINSNYKSIISHDNQPVH